MIIEIGNYRISPYRGDTCWTVQEKGEEDAKGEWKEARYFPATLSAALDRIRELSQKSSPETVKDIDKFRKVLKELDEKIYNKLDEIKEELPENFS